MSASAPPLAGRHAVVTGGGRGIGLAIARRLAADGATLTLLGPRRRAAGRGGAGAGRCLRRAGGLRRR